MRIICYRRISSGSRISLRDPANTAKQIKEMTLKKLSLTLLTLSLCTTLSAAQMVIPASGSIPGAGDSLWQSDVTIHNVSAGVAPITLSFRTTGGEVATESLTLSPHQTLSIENVVESLFGQTSATGAIVIDADEFVLRKLAVTSQTYNLSERGRFGQDIPAIPGSSALSAGDTAVINGPVNPEESRFNFGLYTLEEASVEWVVIRQDGSIASSVIKSYDGLVQVQYNQGISTLLGASIESSDVVYARVLEGSAVFFGSIVDAATGDPAFVPAVATRENFEAQFLGVDLNEDGVIDLFDADHDGVLDAPVRLATHGFPNFFRIIVSDPEGNEVSLDLLDASNEVLLLEDGLVQWVPAGELRGSAGALRIVATDGFASSEFIIPVLFR